MVPEEWRRAWRVAGADASSASRNWPGGWMSRLWVITTPTSLAPTWIRQHGTMPLRTVPPGRDGHR